jgi:hypothetical protein
MTRPIGMAEMNRVFEVIDALGISREAITVPLLPSGDGLVETLPGGKVRIVIPDGSPLDAWLPTLRRRLEEIGLGAKRDSG